MNGLESILFATDLSASSRHAALRAAWLAGSAGARLTLLHVLAGTAFDDLRRWLSEPATAVKDEASLQLQNLADELGLAREIAIDTCVVAGHPVEEVTRQADARGAGLIVTGTRGTGFFRGVAVGSTAERIAKRAQLPVLMVRQLPHETYRRVLVPVDFSPWSLAAVETARRVAPQATLVLMHAVDVPFEGKLRLAGVADARITEYREKARREALQRLGDLAAAAGLAPADARLITSAGADPWMLIVQAEQAHDCDLVVIGRQGRHALDEFLLGSTTRMAMSECSADVLVSSRKPA